VAEIGVGVVGDDGEEDYDRKTEKVGDVDGDVERGVLKDADGALHPVDDAFGVGAWWRFTPDEDARVGREPGEIFGLVRIAWHSYWRWKR